jgi:hypothetical protein
MEMCGRHARSHTCGRMFTCLLGIISGSSATPSAKASFASSYFTYKPAVRGKPGYISESPASSRMVHQPSLVDGMRSHSVSSPRRPLVTGLPIDSDEATLRSAFKDLAKELHPDRNSAKDADEQFQKLRDEYSRLLRNCRTVRSFARIEPFVRGWYRAIAIRSACASATWPHQARLPER